MLEAIREPVDLRLRDEADLKQIADELRSETINAVAVTGGHLGAGLGVVELTVALHYVFDTPRDKLIWDVGASSTPCSRPRQSASWATSTWSNARNSRPLRTWPGSPARKTRL